MTKLPIFLFEKMKKRKCFIRQSEKLHHKLNVNLTWSKSKKEGDSLLSLSLFNLQCETNILIQKKWERNALGSNTTDALGWALEPNLVTRLRNIQDLMLEFVSLSVAQTKKTCIFTWLNWFQYYFGMLIFRHLTLLKKREV